MNYQNLLQESLSAKNKKDITSLFESITKHLIRKKRFLQPKKISIIQIINQYLYDALGDPSVDGLTNNCGFVLFAIDFVINDLSTLLEALTVNHFPAKYFISPKDVPLFVNFFSICSGYVIPKNLQRRIERAQSKFKAI